MMKEYDLKNIEELKEQIIDDFKICLSMSKDDIEELWVFVYENNGHYSYYIPSEIKRIIKKELNLE